RPTLYGALHPITRISRSSNHQKKKVDVVGPVCETGDCFIEDWPMNTVAAGDLVGIWGTGAYGIVSTSNYNSRLRPVEVLVDGNRFRVVRMRESRLDLIRGER